MDNKNKKGEKVQVVRSNFKILIDCSFLKGGFWESVLKIVQKHSHIDLLRKFQLRNMLLNI